MEQQIHNLEMDAYCAVLRAFKAQSEVLTWVIILLNVKVKSQMSMFSAVK